MAELVQKRKITHVLKISAQSEQLQQRYCRFYWFLKIACLRYEGPWGRDCVSGVPPCLVHSQNLSELIGHSDGGQKQFRTAVRALSLSHIVFFFTLQTPKLPSTFSGVTIAVRSDVMTAAAATSFCFMRKKM